MGISVEPQIFTIRGGEEHNKFGDPYSFVITAVKSGEHSIRFVGMVKKLSKKEIELEESGVKRSFLSTADFRAIRKYFVSIGITYAEWERVGKEGVHSHGVTL